MQRPELDDCQLLEILRGKDSRIVGLEAHARDHQREMDLREQELSKLKQELGTYQDLIVVKDESIVRLTNQVHELELSQVVAAGLRSSTSSSSYSSSAPTAVMPASSAVLHGVPGAHIPFSPRAPSSAKSAMNGLSFDSDRFEFREFVEVGVQTSKKAASYGAEIMASDTFIKQEEETHEDTNGYGLHSAQEWEKLQDMVTAYEMQNRFLNKEVLELNQLRTQANDREQKLFM